MRRPNLAKSKINMTTKNKRANKVPTAAKKLALNKEMLKDLTPDANSDNVRGGARRAENCTVGNTGCTGGGGE